MMCNCSEYFHTVDQCNNTSNAVFIHKKLLARDAWDEERSWSEDEGAYKGAGFCHEETEQCDVSDVELLFHADHIL